ncbi:MAG: hypothetical protein ACR5KV_05340 [Wolbachia sp.]
MLFNLELGSVGYTSKHRLATIKINDKEERNLSTEIYYIDDSHTFPYIILESSHLIE